MIFKSDDAGYLLAIPGLYMVTPPNKVPTRREEEAWWDEWPTSAVEQATRQTASERHQFRKDATLYAAALRVLSETPGRQPWLALSRSELRLVAVLIRLDLGGAAKPGQMPRTRRPAYASRLGSGRWLANDGPAYRQAAEDMLLYITSKCDVGAELYLSADEKLRWIGGLNPLAVADYVEDLLLTESGESTVDQAVECLRKEGFYGKDILEFVEAECLRQIAQIVANVRDHSKQSEGWRSAYTGYSDGPKPEDPLELARYWDALLEWTRELMDLPNEEQATAQALATLATCTRIAAGKET